METTILISIKKEELKQLIDDAVRDALPRDITTSNPQPFIKGIHELAAYLKISPSRTQKLKNEGVFPYFQDGRTLLFDPDQVRSAMHQFNKKRKGAK